MRNKRWLATLLIVVLIFSYITPMVSYANEYTEMEIKVCCDGYVEKQMILEDASGRKYAPLSWLTYYGSLVMKENDTTYEYYYVGEEKTNNFSRRIFVNKKDNKFSIKLYRQHKKLNPIEYFKWLNTLTEEQWEVVMKSGATNSVEAYDALGMGEGSYTEFDNGTFGKKFTHNNVLYVPMDQVLSLCGVNVDVADGNLYIQHDTLSIWQALYQYDISDVVYDIDKEIWGNEGLSATAYVIDTGLNFNVFRLDGWQNTGRIMDYEELFEIYLSDNEAYLSTFEDGNSPIQERQKMYQEYFKGIESAWSLYGGILEYADALGLKEALGKEGFDLVKESDGAELASGIVSGIVWLYDYWCTYCNQVDDHREMLLAVYDYQIEKEPYLSKAKEMKEWPSYKAVQNVSQKYSTSKIDTETVVWDGIKDLVSDEAGGFLTGTAFPALKPWALTITLTKPFMKEDYETIADASMLGYFENTLDIAYDTYTDCLYSGKYDEDTLNTMRLAGIMTLVASKYGYDYNNKQLHTERNDEKLEKIQEMLEAFYLVADGLEMDTDQYYFEKMKELKDSLNYLTVSWDPDQEEETTKPEDNEDETEQGSISKPGGNSKPEEPTTKEPETEDDTESVINIDFTKMDVEDLRTLTYSEASRAGMECVIYDLKNSLGYTFTKKIGNIAWEITYVYYNDELFSGEKYPSSCAVIDYAKDSEGVEGDSNVVALENVKTGMTYEEIAAITTVGRLERYSTGRAWAGQDLGEYGYYSFWFTECSDGRYVLTSVDYSRIKYHAYENLDDYFSDDEYALLDMDLLDLFNLSYGEVVNLPTDVSISNYTREIAGKNYDEIECYIYMPDEAIQFYIYYAVPCGEEISQDAYPYSVYINDCHVDGNSWMGYDGGGKRKIRENITTGMLCTDIKPLLSSYTYEECLEIVLIENVADGRTFTYYFANLGDDEWTWLDEESVLVGAKYQDLNRLP